MSKTMADLVTSVEGLKDTVTNRVDALGKNVEDVDSRVKVMDADYKSDLSELKKQLDDHVAAGIEWDEEQKTAFLSEIMEKARAAEQKRGFSGLAPGIQKTLELPDPWAVGFDPYYFKTLDHKKLLDDDIKAFEKSPRSKKARQRKGMQSLVTLPAQNEAHKHLCRMAMDVKLLDKMGFMIARKNDVEYEGLAQFFPNVAEAWKFYQTQYVGSIAGKAAGDAMDTVDTANWVPTGFSSELRELIRIQLRVANIFETFPLPKSPFEMPIDMTDLVGDFMPETTDITNPFTDTTLVQALVDAKVTFTGRKFRGRVFHSGELDEDTAIALVPQIRKHLVDIQAQTRESAIINGQATADIDTGDSVIGDNDFRKGFDGLRYFIEVTLSQNNVDGSTFDKDVLIRAVRNAMGPEYGMDPNDIVHIPSMSAFLRMLVVTEVLTLDKYGPQATILTGELANIGGAAIVPSRHVRMDLNAAGIFDDVTTTKTIDIVVNKRAFMIGEVRQVTLELQRWVSTDQNELVSFSRYDFQHLFGTKKTAAVIDNIAV